MIITLLISAAIVHAQAGYPDSLRKYSDSGKVPFRIGNSIVLDGGPSKYPVNGYQPGLLTGSDPARDKFYQEMAATQFNQIETGNDMKMMSLWTGGTALVDGHYVAKTNLFDDSGPIHRTCTWAESQTHHLTVRGHVMVYNPSYTLPTFPRGQTPLFTRDSAGRMALNPAYKPADLRDMLESYVRQVVDATMLQNALSRKRHGYRVMEAWDVTNEVVQEDKEIPGLGFAYRSDDPWFKNGPQDPKTGGYDYVVDVFRWAADEMKSKVGRRISGQKLTARDRFLLYYNEYNLEWKASKMTETLNLIKHVRDGGGRVDGLGFQGHVQADGVNLKQFDADIAAAIKDGLRFSVTEMDCTIKKSLKPSLEQQEINHGREHGEVLALCLKHKKSCDCFQMWGATDDGSWLQNGEATAFTRWVADTRPGPTNGKFGYWPKMGQYVSAALCVPSTGELDPNSGRKTSDAWSQMLAVLKG